MSISYDRVQEDDVLWDVHRTRMGNTTMSRMGSWSVRVIEKSADSALVSWNGNKPERWSRHRIERLRRSPYKPKEVRS